MQNELNKYLIEAVDLKSKRVYAVQDSRNDEEFKKHGFIFDPDIQEYFRYLSEANIENLLNCVIHGKIDSSVSFKDVKKLPRLGIHHADTKQIFENYGEYFQWCKK